MEHLERQSMEIRDIMCHNSDLIHLIRTFDRVSGADEEADTPIISSELQYVPNVHSDTNKADDTVSQETQTRDPLISNT